LVRLQPRFDPGQLCPGIPGRRLPAEGAADNSLPGEKQQQEHTLAAGVQPEREAYIPAEVLPLRAEAHTPAEVLPLRAEAHTPAEVPQLKVAAHRLVEAQLMVAAANTQAAEAPGEERRTAAAQPPEVLQALVEPLRRNQGRLQENRNIRRIVHHFELLYRIERRTISTSL